MTTVRPRLFDRALLVLVVALVAAVSTIIGAVAPSGQSHASGWEEEITAGRLFRHLPRFDRSLVSMPVKRV